MKDAPKSRGISIPIPFKKFQAAAEKKVSNLSSDKSFQWVEKRRALIGIWEGKEKKKLFGKVLLFTHMLSPHCLKTSAKNTRPCCFVKMRILVWFTHTVNLPIFLSFFLSKKNVTSSFDISRLFYFSFKYFWDLNNSFFLHLCIFIRHTFWKWPFDASHSRIYYQSLKIYRPILVVRETILINEKLRHRAIFPWISRYYYSIDFLKSDPSAKLDILFTAVVFNEHEWAFATLGHRCKNK